ncbi:hypothetical protein FLSI110296_06115 [Flavobacterium sinopsychrotolerans]|uniref:Fn3-like domain-containing protein n=1 Tax=Flavobacterium sinopsychrotolerans TaxID=604089 RepID=A0A1H8LAP9_9FLAO|nr:hypothetical protein [Flavobacterium sinopsychrotolerans]SEO02159.1 hypothetical protein SAMN04487942_1601 [Flavobacterium sinopsychrotolerans]
MYKYLNFALTFIFLQLFTPFGFAQGVSMSPTRLFFTGKPGEVVSQNVVMHNGSENDYIFNINLKDWKREEDGTKVYFEPGILKQSSSAWISTLETNINLPAKSTQEVLVTMRIPADASTVEISNSMLFFTQIGKQKDELKLDKGIGIIALFEFGLHVYYTPPESKTISLDIISIETLPKQADNSQAVAIRLFNDGTVVNDASVELELTNTISGEEIKLMPINISMMPGTHQTITHRLPEHLKGKYSGVVIVKMAGSNDLRVGEKDFEF